MNIQSLETQTIQISSLLEKIREIVEETQDEEALQRAASESHKLLKQLEALVAEEVSPYKQAIQEVKEVTGDTLKALKEIKAAAQSRQREIIAKQLAEQREAERRLAESEDTRAAAIALAAKSTSVPKHTTRLEPSVVCELNQLPVEYLRLNDAALKARLKQVGREAFELELEGLVEVVERVTTRVR